MSGTKRRLLFRHTNPCDEEQKSSRENSIISRLQSIHKSVDDIRVGARLTQRMCSATSVGKRTANIFMEQTKRDRKRDRRIEPGKSSAAIREEDHLNGSPAGSSRNLLREPISTLERFDQFKSHRLKALVNKSDFSEYFKIIGDRLSARQQKMASLLRADKLKPVHAHPTADFFSESPVLDQPRKKQALFYESNKDPTIRKPFMSTHQQPDYKSKEGLSGKLKRQNEGRIISNSKKNIFTHVKQRTVSSLVNGTDMKPSEISPNLFMTMSQRDSFEDESGPASSKAGQQTTPKQSYMESLITTHKDKLQTAIYSKQGHDRFLKTLSQVEKEESSSRHDKAASPKQDHCSMVSAMNGVLRSWREVFPRMFETLTELAKADDDKGYEQITQIRDSLHKAFEYKKSRVAGLVDEGEDLDRRLTLLISENVFLMESLQEQLETGVGKVRQGLRDDGGVRNIFPDA